MRGFYRAVKRFLDVTASFLGLVLLSPLLLAVSILIKIDSRGPVIFRQTRIGRNGKVFEIYKLVTKYLQHKLGIHIVHIFSENFFLPVIGKSIADVIEGRVVLANDICAEMR